jgi:hypothetical protein
MAITRVTNNQYPVLDGIAPSWSDIKCTLAASGLPLLEMWDLKAVNTGRTVEVGSQLSGGRVKKRTTGALTQEASITVYRDQFSKFCAALAKAAPKVRGDYYAISLVHFGFVIQHTPPGSSEIFERRLTGCRVLTDALNGAEGTDADSVEVGLSVMEIVDIIDGKKIVLL